MQLTLVRTDFTDISTIGKLYIDDVFFCYTLEDAVRDKKINGVTAIPYGTYEVIINFSNRFQKPMPLLLNVPNFEGIRIHSLNTSDQTEGCIGIGFTKGNNYIGQSRKAFNELMPVLQKALKNGKVFIEIKKEAAK
jgi:hypothetical protein